MEISGTQSIPAPRAAVWDALNDPAVLKTCLPGCESVERVSPEEFKVLVAAAIGPLRAKFNGVLRITEAQAPVSCVMVFEGQGGAVGFGQGSATVELREAGEGTELGYTARAQVGGKLAQVGSRLIDSVAKKMSDDFFKAFVKNFKADLPPMQGAVEGPSPARPNMPPAARGDAPRPGVAAAVPAAAAAQTPTPAAATRTSTSGPVLVPGWWLAVAAALGSAFTLAGALALR
jgi:hypothetical protein